MKKTTLVSLITALGFSGAAHSDPDSLSSTVYLRAGFGGAAEQSTGLRYGLQYDYARPVGEQSAVPMTQVEFQGRNLVGMNLNGVNISPLIHSLSATGVAGLLNGGNLFLLGAAGVSVAVASQSESRDGDGKGFNEVVGDDPQAFVITSAGDEENSENGGENGTPTGDGDDCIPNVTCETFTGNWSDEAEYANGERHEVLPVDLLAPEMKDAARRN